MAVEGEDGNRAELPVLTAEDSSAEVDVALGTTVRLDGDGAEGAVDGAAPENDAATALDETASRGGEASAVDEDRAVAAESEDVLGAAAVVEDEEDEPAGYGVCSSSMLISSCNITALQVDEMALGRARAGGER